MLHQIKHIKYTQGEGGVTVPNKTKTTLTKSIMMWCKVIGDRYNKRQQSRHGVPEEVHQRVSLPRAKATEIRAQHGIGSAPQATQQATKQQRQAKKKKKKKNRTASWEQVDKSAVPTHEQSNISAGRHWSGLPGFRTHQKHANHTPQALFLKLT